MCLKNHYSEVAQFLRKTAENRNKEILLSFLDEAIVFINNGSEVALYEAILPFVQDEQSVFPVRKMETYTQGSLAGLPDRLHLERSAEVSENLSNSIWELYTELSREGGNTQTEREDLSSALIYLRDIIRESAHN